jgi:hypothetical protein
MRRALLLLLASCGDNTIPHAAFEARSGSRIGLEIYAYEDGTRQWDPHVFVDRERDEPCTVARWSDGYTYCTPKSFETVYAEEGCVQGELGRWLASEPAPAYFFREFSLPTGEAISRLFRRGDAVAAPAKTYEITNGQCVETQAIGWTYYALGEEVGKDELARVKRVDDKDESRRLALDVFTTDDGLYVPIELGRPLLRDRELGGECKVIDQPNSPVTTCEPLIASEPEFSRDSQCEQRDVVLVELGFTAPDMLVREDEGCRTFARRGAELAPEGLALFLPVGPNCVSVIPPATAHLFEVGEPFDVPQLQRTHEATERRLQRVLLGDGATTLVDGLLFDRELGVDCVRTAVGDGMYRCLPANTLAAVAPYFADELCLEPIEVSLVETGACDPGTRFAIDNRGAEPVVRPLVAPFAGKLYEISTADSCLEYIPPTREVPFTVGAAMPPTAFVTAQLVSE